MSARNWLRVSRDRPCPVCRKPDWCMVARDGGAAICARVESPKRCGESGWIHKLGGEAHRDLPAVRRVEICAKPEPTRDFAALAAEYRSAVNPFDLIRLAAALGVSRDPLGRLGIGWDGTAWTFPMRDAEGTIVGIRRRFPDGRKLSLTGGREGVFVPAKAAVDAAIVGQRCPTLLIAEGPTDCAALVTLGFPAIGRPSCTGGVAIVRELARGRDAVIVADADPPGQRGAMTLARLLALVCPTVRVFAPPAGIKDARAWLCAGATAADVQSVIDQSEPIKLGIETRAAGC
ncbi:MAG: hypothetical protein HZB38_12705 [Planctomycetes bacterium]|nr:hypothetical protein [Planctomycetota bacterium]